MSSVNKILVLFLIAIATSLFGIWEFVQSEFFASRLSTNVTKYTKEYLDADLNFDKIEFKFFPPGIEVNNVTLTKEKKNEGSLFAQVSSLGVEFNPFDLFKTDLTIEKVYFFDGVIKTEIGKDTKKKEVKKENKIQDLIKEIKVSHYIKLLKSKLPFFINNVELNKINVSVNGNSLVTNRSRVSIYENSVNLMLELRDFNLSKIQLGDEVIDEIAINVRLYDNILKIRKLEVKKGMNELSLLGDVNDYLDFDKLKFKVNAIMKGHISVLHDYLNFDDVGKLRRGYLEIESFGKGSLKEFNIRNNLKLFNFDTDFVTGKRIDAEVLVSNEEIRFNKFKLEAGAGTLSLDQPFQFLDLKTKKFVEENILVSAQKLPASDALKFLEESLSILKGDLTGKIRFVLEPKNFYFKIDEGLVVDNLKLITEPNSKPILDVSQVKIEKGFFDIIKSNVFIGLNLGIGNNKIDIDGSIKDGNVLFSSKNAKVDLLDLGKIAGFDIRGKTEFDLKVVSNDIKQRLTLKTKIEQFSFEGFYQDNINTQVIMNFAENSLTLNDIQAKTGQTETKGDFKLFFNNLATEGNIRQSKILIRDLKRMYYPALGKIDLPEDNTFGEWETVAQISGKLELDELNVKGKFIGYNNYVYGESLDLIKVNYSLEKSTLELNDIFLAKANGGVQGGFRLDLKSSDMLVWGNINKIPLNEINNYNKLPLTLTGNLSGLFKGKISGKDKSVTAELNINNSKIHNKTVGDSYIKLSLDRDKINFTSSVLGNEFAVKGVVDLNKSKDNNSNVVWNVNSKDLNQTFSSLSFVDHLKTGFSGAIEMTGDLYFNIWDINAFSGKMNLKKLLIMKGLVNVNYLNRGGSQFVVENGVIKKWNLDVRGGKFYIISNGEGNLTKNYDVKTRVKADATLLEVFNVLISKASGTLIGSIHNFRKEGDEDYVAKLVSSNLSMNSDFMPLALTKGELLVNYKKRKLILNKLKAQLNTGSFYVNGLIDLTKIIPDINIRYEFKNAGIPLLKKSSVTFSGKGSFVGKTIPYTLGGEIQVQKCNIVNEITDFAGGEEIIKADVDYLPQNKSKALNQFLNFNININTLEPIRITNSMADLGFTGNLLLSGGEKDPRLAGKIGLAPTPNQIFFKNNTFNLSKGNVFFYERNKVSNPELDFQATSVINKYNVNISVLGQLQEFKLDLSSDPVLSQADVLSLVAFGFTEDLSTNLSDSEKESMTRAGVGSIIFDRFKINETLKNEFGLQVNLGTEISQEEGSYLSQRNAEGGEIGRVRSATTIEIKKQISDAVGLSVSSTVGGTVGQRQSMNLNYNLNKNLSVEGVYESNTESQSEDLNNDSSLGADVKIRWSFR